MIVVLKKNTSKEHIEEFSHWLESFNVKAHPIYGQEDTVLGLVGDTSVLDIDTLRLNDIVERAMKVQEPYKQSNRKFHPEDSIIEAGGVRFGDKKLVVMAGPCSVESDEQIGLVTERIKAAGASMLRGGAFKPRSSPYSFQGLRTEGLFMLKKAREDSGLPIISEITNLLHLDIFLEYVDVIQVGTRNMQNFELLKALGRTTKPVLLKRGFANTIEELLMAADHIMSAGNPNVILCERGIRTFETATRNTMDISAIPVLKKLSHLPVVVDPSHASGAAWLVPPLAKAAVAAGADGLIIEVHPDPAKALSDGAQSLTPDAFDALMASLKALAPIVGRSL